MIALVWLAGGLGAGTRFLLDGWLSHWVRGSGTFVINVTGAFVLGLLAGWQPAHDGSPLVLLVLGTGFLGGYTTFSAAMLESARIARGGRWVVSIAHAAAMLAMAVAAAALGLWLGSR